MTEMEIFIHNALWRPPTGETAKVVRMKIQAIHAELRGEELAEAALAAMRIGQRYTSRDLLPDVSSTMSSLVLRELLQAGKIARELTSRRIYYFLPDETLDTVK